jgi:hypothetical protein
MDELRRTTRWLAPGGWFPGSTRPPTASSPSPGPDALGYLLYSTDGALGHRLAAGRPGFAADDLLGGITKEQARAAEGFVAYAGRHSFFGGRVLHHVELSLFPNWVGNDQQRWV